MRPKWYRLVLSLMLLIGLVLSGVVSEGISLAAQRPRAWQAEGTSIASVSPGSGLQGQTLDVAITGNATNFVQDLSVASFGDGIMVNSLLVTDALNATANITVDAVAAAGPRDVNVVTDVEVPAALAGGFTVALPPNPQIRNVAPADGAQGRTLDVAIEGSETSFADGVSAASFGEGIVVNSTTVSDATHATAGITIDMMAVPGPRDVNVLTGSEAPLALAGGFNVLEVSIQSVDPAGGNQGTTIDVAITGSNTGFGEGSAASFGEGIVVNSTSVLDATHAVANVTIGMIAAPGARDVNVVTGSEAPRPLAGGFSVREARLSSVTPGSGNQGTTLDVALVGANTDFAQGVSKADFGEGITVNSMNVNDTMHAVANITIAGKAAPGSRDVKVGTGLQVVSLAGGFTVLEARILSVVPGTGVQSRTLDVAITGTNTDFVQDVSVVSFGSGIAVNSLTVVDATHATANITISIDADLGGRDVNIVTGPQVPIALADGFVVLPKAIIYSISPTQAFAGDPVTITGRGFLDAQGEGYVSFGSVKVTDYISWSNTKIVCRVPAGAVSGNVTVTTFTGASDPVAFKVLNTHVGRKVIVKIDANLTVMFDTVTAVGTTSATRGATPTIPKYSAISGYDRIIVTDATWSGNVTVYFSYNINRVPRREHVYVMHLEKGRWFQRTINQSAKKPVVTGRARSLGEFTLALKGKKKVAPAPAKPGQAKKVVPAPAPAPAAATTTTTTKKNNTNNSKK